MGKKTGPKPRPIAERLWEKCIPEPNTGCWLWLASLDRGGYGKFGVPGRGWRPASRVAWEVTHGPVPAGFGVSHRCGNHSCCNPWHLVLTTAQQQAAKSLLTLPTALRRKRVGRPVATRFWEKVKKGEECWLWLGRRNAHGYGTLKVGSRTNGSQASALAHRLSWELAHGPIPMGLFVCHHCDNPPCVNPAHLFLGTNADNMADMAAKGRARGPEPEQASKAALTWQQVEAIRTIYGSGFGTQKDLGEMFGVTQTAIGYIVRGVTWRQAVDHASHPVAAI